MEGNITAFEARRALDEINRTRQVVHLQSQWYGQYLVILGAATTAYYLAAETVAGGAAGIVAMIAGWAVFITLLDGWAKRQPVLRLGLQRTRTRVLVLYALFAGLTVLFSATVLPGVPGRWMLGLLPAVPCLIGAWWALRR